MFARNRGRLNKLTSPTIVGPHCVTPRHVRSDFRRVRAGISGSKFSFEDRVWPGQGTFILHVDTVQIIGIAISDGEHGCD